MNLSPLVGFHLDLDLTHLVLATFTVCMGVVGSLLGSSVEAFLPAVFGDLFRYGKTSSDRRKRSAFASRWVITDYIFK